MKEFSKRIFAISINQIGKMGVPADSSPSKQNQSKTRNKKRSGSA
jgi:hypothetical protein